MKSHYREISAAYPKDDLEPIIFLHGLFQSGKCFLKVASIIANKTGRKAYLPDARNHGDSQWTDGMDYDLLVHDLLEFMDELKVEKAILIGHSMGGRTALYFSIKYPHRVGALVVEDMTAMNVDTRGANVTRTVLEALKEVLKQVPPDMDEKDIRHLLFMGSVNPLGAKYVIEETVPEILTNDIFPVVKEGVGYRMKCNMAAVEAMLTNNALMQNLPRRNMVYKGKALFLYGTKPYFQLDRDPTIKKLFPKALIKQVEGSTHWIHMDLPYQFSSIVSDFILNGFGEDSDKNASHSKL